MADAFAGYTPSLVSPAQHASAVTPSDTVDLPTASRSLWIGGAGSLALDTVGGETVTFAGILAGMVLPVRAARVRATGTTATAIVALW